MSVSIFNGKKTPLCAIARDKSRRISDMVQDRLDKKVEQSKAAAAEATAAIASLMESAAKPRLAAVKRKP